MTALGLRDEHTFAGQGRGGQSIKEKSKCKAKEICTSLAPQIKDLIPERKGIVWWGMKKTGRKEQTASHLMSLGLIFKKNLS